MTYYINAILEGSFDEALQRTEEALKTENFGIISRIDIRATLKAKIDVWGQTRTDLVVMRRLKEKMDPFGVLNPGRFVGGI